MRVKMSKVPSDLKAVTKVAVKFFMMNYVDAKTRKKMESLDIHWYKFEPERRRDLAWASIKEVDEEVRRPSSFEVAFNLAYEDIKARDYLLTLFHELTHIRQYATRELVFNENGTTTWKDKVYPADHEYWISGWEQEARGMELAAYMNFRTAHPEFELKKYRVRYNGRRKSGWTGVPSQ